jgi:opacity protein-like surface antigen
MRKIMVCVTLIVFTAGFASSLSAYGEKKFNVFANLGYAFSDFEGLVFEFGGELQVTGNLYGQLLLDYYPDPFGDEGVPDFNDSAYGLNLYAVYKYRMVDNINLFAKTGVHLTSIKVSAVAFGIPVTATDTDFGVGAGGGIEYLFNDKWGMQLGGTVKFLFAEDTAAWFKVYGGVSYRVK